MMICSRKVHVYLASKGIFSPWRFFVWSGIKGTRHPKRVSHSFLLFATSLVFYSQIYREVLPWPQKDSNVS